MKKFLKHLWICMFLYESGFFFSENIHYDQVSLESKKKVIWGFVRLNFERGEKKEYAIVDIDFQEDLFFHVHQGPEKDLFRVNL